jgi:hypothetical protein
MAAWSLERTMRLLAVMEKSSQFGGLAKLDQVLFVSSTFPVLE